MEIRSNFLPRKAGGALTPGSSAGSSPSQSPSFTKRFSSHLPTRKRKQKHEKESQQAAAQLTQQQRHNQQHPQQSPLSDGGRSVGSHDEPHGYLDDDDGAAACQARSLSRSYAAQAQIQARAKAGSYPALSSSNYPYSEKHGNPELLRNARSAVSKTREKEVAWLLATLRKEIDGQKELLRKCIAGTLPASGQTIGESLLLSSPRSEVIKGYCTLEGNSIVKADLTIKFPNTHKEAIRTQVAPFCPYYLKQLAAARNKANLALEALCAWPEEFAVSRDVAEVIIQRVHSLISDGEYAMDQPPRLEPLLMTTVDAKIFQPPLPPTVVIAFTVQSSVLQATILSLGPTQAHQHYHHLLPHHHHHHHHRLHHHHHHAPPMASVGGSASSMLTIPPMFKASGSSASLNLPAAATLSSRTASPPGLGPPGMAVTAAVVPSAAAAAAGGMAAAGIAASSAFSAATSAATLQSSQPVVPPIVAPGATSLLPPPAAASVAPGRTIKVRGELMEVLEEILVESRSPRLENLMATLERVKREVERWKGCLAAVA